MSFSRSSMAAWGGAGLNVQLCEPERGVRQVGRGRHHLAQLRLGLLDAAGLNVGDGELVTGWREPRLDLDDGSQVLDGFRGLALGQSDPASQEEPVQIGAVLFEHGRQPGQGVVELWGSGLAYEHQLGG
jgi:hypothetical protein